MFKNNGKYLEVHYLVYINMKQTHSGPMELKDEVNKRKNNKTSKI